MKRRQFVSVFGGGLVGGRVDRWNAPPPSPGPPDDYDGPMISAHEHFLFMPQEEVDWFVDWMSENGWKRVLAFSTSEQLDLYEAHPRRFIPFDQEPFSRYLVPRVIDLFGIDDPQLPPYMPNPDNPPELHEVPSLFEASLEAHPEWAGIGELGLYLVAAIEGADGRPDADWLMELYDIAADHDVTVMLHPPHPEQFGYDPTEEPLENPVVEGLRNAFDEHPETHFLVHGFRRNELDAVNPLLEDHDNWDYDVSGIMFGHPGFWPHPFLGDGTWDERRDWFESHMTDAHIDDHVDDAFAVWEPIFAEHPDRVLWGIDAGRQWHFYDRYFDVHDRFYRGLLGRLPEADAQRIAHVNARRLW